MVGISSGQVTGAEVNLLIASPFYAKAIDIIQEVKNYQGSLTGIRISTTVADSCKSFRMRCLDF